ncbi:MAG: hypothetical protein EI684_19650 [Candidatus Viridilinea halotolerans]|uniref:Uncharacterized protein n=1 Tax=Candidatus Viridilinea halotolerans TaxID=2491704 RepID=A0A426TSH2_9CHLR|nr:MAG: hypothetical protein EI684_19650 [Candidatus Viridilinea halotolerans]
MGAPDGDLFTGSVEEVRLAAPSGTLYSAELDAEDGTFTLRNLPDRARRAGATAARCATTLAPPLCGALGRQRLPR